ncbi:hypothetical protein GCM10022205_06430 [Spinactinospora alkalitolerans]
MCSIRLLVVPCRHGEMERGLHSPDEAAGCEVRAGPDEGYRSPYSVVSGRSAFGRAAGRSRTAYVPGRRAPLTGARAAGCAVPA